MAGSNNTTKIDSLVDPVADEQLLKLKISGKLLRDELNELLKTWVTLSAAMGGSSATGFAKALKEVENAADRTSKKLNQVKDNTVAYAAKQEEIYNKYLVQLSRQEAARQQAESKAAAADAKEAARVAKQIAQNEQKTAKITQNSLKEAAALNAKSAKEADAAAKAAQAFNILNAAYQETLLIARNVGAEFGENSKKFLDVTKSANFLREKIDGINHPLKQFKDNVGNYASGTEVLNKKITQMGTAFTQITRELPAFANSVQTGFMALSNNIPMLFDEISRVNTVLKETGVAQASAARTQAKETALAGGASEEAANQMGDLAAQTALAAAEGKRGSAMFSAIAKSLFSFQTLLSLGVVLLTVYGKQMVEFVGALFQGKEAMDMFIERQNALNETFKSDDFKKGVTQYYELAENIKLAKDGVVSKDGVLKQYNETLGKTTGYTEDFNEAEKLTLERGGKVLELLVLKTAAQNLLAKAAEKASERALELNKTELESASFGDRLKGGFNFEMPGLFESAQAVRDREAKKTLENQKKLGAATRAQNASDLKKEEDQFLKAFKTMQKQAAYFAKNNNLSFFGDEGKPEKDKKAPKDMTNTDLLEYNRLQLEEKQRITKMILDDDTLSYETRKAALEQYLIQSQKLLDNGEQIALSQADLRKQQKINIDQDYQNKSLQLKEDGQKQAEKLDNDELAKHKRHLSDLLQVSKESEQEQLESLNQGAIIAAQKLNDAKEDLINAKTLEFSKGKLTEQQYNRDLLAINDEYNVQRLAQEIAVQEAILEIRKGNRDKALSEAGLNGATPAELNKISSEANKGINSTENTISGLKTQYKSAVTKQTVDNAKDGKADSKDVKKSFEAAIANTLTLLGDAKGLTDDLYASQISQLEKVGQKIQENAQIERDGISRSLDTQANKARAMAVLDAQTASAQKNIQTQIATEKTKQARADKAAAIAEIILNTAVAATKVTAQAGLLGLLTGVPAVITLGAIQLARVVATPIPQFAKGGTVSRTGLIVYGEQGKELVEEPGRTPYYSPGVATLAHVPAGTKITPNHMLPVTPKWESNRSDNSDVVAAIDRLARKEQPKPKSGRINGWISEQRQADAYAAYSAKHFK